MGRRLRKKESQALIILLVAAFVIYKVVDFVKNNIETIKIALIVVVTLVLGYFVLKYIIKRVKLRNEIFEYQNTHYFKETHIPYSPNIHNRGESFEILVYNKIREKIGNRYPMLANLSIPQKEAINIDSQIDMMLFHSTGIYVIEAKNFSGPLMGRIDEDQWIPYIKEEYYVKKERKIEYNINHNLWEKWKQTKQKSNPVKQNDIHIRTLKDVIDVDYKSVVIFSDDMLVENASKEKTIPCIFGLDEFLNYLSYQNEVYSHIEIDEIYGVISKYNRGNTADVTNLHISRVSRK